MSDAGGYVPVACAFHERLEFAVLRRQRLRLRYRQAGRLEECVALPTDVVTREGAEWLHCTDDKGRPLVLRLDWLVKAEPA